MRRPDGSGAGDTGVGKGVGLSRDGVFGMKGLWAGIGGDLGGGSTGGDEQLVLACWRDTGVWEGVGLTRDGGVCVEGFRAGVGGDWRSDAARRAVAVVIAGAQGGEGRLIDAPGASVGANDATFALEGGDEGCLGGVCAVMRRGRIVIVIVVVVDGEGADALVHAAVDAAATGLRAVCCCCGGGGGRPVGEVEGLVDGREDGV